MFFWSALVADYEMFDVCDMNGVTVIRLRARELDETKLQRLTQELAKAVEEPQRKRLVIDLEEVAFLTSTGIGAIIALQKRLHASGGTLKLCGLHPDIQSLFAITQVDRLFDIQPNADEAVKSFS
jgi:anti-sigma B factor antagonist